MEKALANGWEITPFKRNYKMPQAAISHQPSAISHQPSAISHQPNIIQLCFRN
jgi:hypothetical protein